MNMLQFANTLQKQCYELEDLRFENASLRERLAKYESHVSEELDFWQNTYGNILTKLVNKG